VSNNIILLFFEESKISILIFNQCDKKKYIMSEIEKPKQIATSLNSVTVPNDDYLLIVT